MSRPGGTELDEQKLGYEIAEPISYEAFPTDGEPSNDTAKSGAPSKSVRSERSARYAEDWDDAQKERPQASDYDSRKFRPSERAHESRLTRGAQRDTRAVWIVHGMGQQIPFETLDSLTNGLLQSFRELNAPQPAPTPRLRTVRIGKEVLQRVELDVTGEQGDYELHLYESYWAPKTEGVANLTDVVSFLWDGGTRGLMNSFRDFNRAMFGGVALFKIRLRTAVWICLTLATLAALTVINGVIAAAAAAQLNISAFDVLRDHWEALAALASCMTAVAFSFGVLLFLGSLAKPRNLSRWQRRLISILSWLGFMGTLTTILKTSALMLVFTRPELLGRVQNRFGDLARVPTQPLQGFATLVIFACIALSMVALMGRAFSRSEGSEPNENWFLIALFVLSYPVHLIAVLGPASIWFHRDPWTWLPHVLSFVYKSWWVWPFLIALSAKVRGVMVQYVGDVAIYVTSNKLNRFDEVRTKIKDAARTVASAVYLAFKPNSQEFLYEHVAIVGHSLGSVIAYDTLNRLMLDDWLNKNQLGVASRTRTMVTFGSPLNKTAFFFTIQGSNSLHIRERLASTVQPLIQSYPKFRKRTFKWINVHSGNDIISGPLRFYDLPGMQEKDDPSPFAIKNVVDKDAAVPIVAHVDYWKNPCIWRELRQQIAP
jgi:hypothetical protein